MFELEKSILIKELKVEKKKYYSLPISLFNIIFIFIGLQKILIKSVK